MKAQHTEAAHAAKAAAVHRSPWGVHALALCMILAVVLGPTAVRLGSRWLESPETRKPWAITERIDQGSNRLEVRVSDERITVADEVVVNARLLSPPGLAPPEPTPSFAANGWSVVDAFAYEPVIATDGRSVWAWSWTIEPFLDGDYEIPSIQITQGPQGAQSPGPWNIASAPITVTVGSLLLDAEASQPSAFLGAYRDVPPTMSEESVGIAVWIRLAIGLLAAAFIEGAWLISRAMARSGGSEETFADSLAAWRSSTQDADARSAVAAGRRTLTLGINELANVSVSSITRSDATRLLARDPDTLRLVDNALASVESAAFDRSQPDTTQAWSIANERIQRAIEAVAARLSDLGDVKAAPNPGRNHSNGHGHGHGHGHGPVMGERSQGINSPVSSGASGASTGERAP